MLAGDRDALADFGVLQQEGYRDGRGRVLVRANPKAAARAFLRAASAGSAPAAQSLGYCYDVGVGVRRNGKLAMKWYLRAWRHRYPTAAANIGTVYRDRGLLARAVRWWQRAVETGLPEEAVEVGYSYQYGIGVRRNLGKAVECYRLAIRARNILAFAQEAAMYHLAVLHLDRQPPERTKAVALLERASKDRDYPAAMRLLTLLRKGRPLVPCRCRRVRVKTPLANARCEIHRKR
jgi:TPR repeat protein